MDKLKVYIQYLMLCEFKNNKNATETPKKNCIVYGQHLITIKAETDF